MQVDKFTKPEFHRVRLYRKALRLHTILTDLSWQLCLQGVGLFLKWSIEKKFPVYDWLRMTCYTCDVYVCGDSGHD